jgi:drug/metabolite transporter (DMT)-like permease
MSIKSFPFILLLGSLWGSTLVVSRFGIGQFDPVVFVGLRLVIGTAAFVLFYAFSTSRRWSRDKKVWRHALVLGVFGTALPMSTLISSLQFQSSGVTSVLVTTAPAIIVVMAHISLPDERLNRYKSAGVLLALAGALLIVARGETGLADVTQANPVGYLLVFIGLVAEGIMAMHVRNNMRGMDAFDVTSIRLLAATSIVLPVAIIWRGVDLSQVTGMGVLSLLYAGLAGAFAGQMLAFYITRQFGATAFSLTSYVVPVVTAATGVLLLGETITGGMVMGLLLIGGGITVINRGGKRA